MGNEKNEIIFIEVGITNKEKLVEVEIEKKRKYQNLAEEVKMQMKATKALVVPIVLTWDSIVTKHFRKHCQNIALPDNLKAYIQSTTLRRTAQSILQSAKEYKEGQDDNETTFL